MPNLISETRPSNNLAQTVNLCASIHNHTRNDRDKLVQIAKSFDAPYAQYMTDAQICEGISARLKVLASLITTNKGMNMPLELLDLVDSSPLVDPVIASDGTMFNRWNLAHILASKAVNPLNKQWLNPDVMTAAPKVQHACIAWLLTQGLKHYKNPEYAHYFMLGGKWSPRAQKVVDSERRRAEGLPTKLPKIDLSKGMTDEVIQKLMSIGLSDDDEDEVVKNVKQAEQFVRDDKVALASRNRQLKSGEALFKSESEILATIQDDIRKDHVERAKKEAAMVEAIRPSLSVTNYDEEALKARFMEGYNRLSKVAKDQLSYASPEQILISLRRAHVLVSDNREAMMIALLRAQKDGLGGFLVDDEDDSLEFMYYSKKHSLCASTFLRRVEYTNEEGDRDWCYVLSGSNMEVNKSTRAKDVIKMLFERNYLVWSDGAF